MAKDNFDIDTPEGMTNSIRWTENALLLINEGGSWIVPRSGWIVRVSHKTRTATITRTRIPEDNLIRVLEACGWTIRYEGKQ